MAKKHRTQILHILNSVRVKIAVTLKYVRRNFVVFFLLGKPAGVRDYLTESSGIFHLTERVTGLHLCQIQIVPLPFFLKGKIIHICLRVRMYFNLEII